MITFFTGLIILAVGGAAYGRLCEKVMSPSDRKTPAVLQGDGVDFVPMSSWKNSLIELLNIAGTGPILGPIQGVLFGPIAFITIPIGCVIGGAFHDYMVGMISIRNKGEQTPDLVRRFLGKNVYLFYNVFVCLLMLLVGVVFVYTPGDLFVIHILGQESSSSNPVLWAVYGCIFAYYVLAALFPIDKIIGRIYPVFGAILLISAVGVFIGLFVKGYPLVELWEAHSAGYPYKSHFLPLFFVTVTCGILSGFHSTQATLVSRTVADEREGRMTFYNMMIAEGFIAMIWAAAGMGALQSGLVGAQMLADSATSVVGIVAKDMLGPVGGVISVIGVIVLPITSGDTALRSLRLMIGDAMHLDQTKKKNKMTLAIAIFTVVALMLFWAKGNPEGFSILWRYFSWANETTAVFACAMIAVYMKQNKMPYIMAMIPGVFYTFIVSGYIINARIGLRQPWTVSYIAAVILAVVFAGLISKNGKKTLAAAACLALILSGCATTSDNSVKSIPKEEEAKVILGDEQFDEYIPMLEGKRVALFSNHTGIVGDETSGSGDRDADTHFGVDEKGNEITYGRHILDALIEQDVNVVAIFSPEHGFRGTEDAGASIDNSVDEKTGVPILSLYADDNSHAPAKEDMDRFDVLVVDMQDVGLRYYTYYISMYYLMDACASYDKEFMILDRPNPNGFYVDGPILKEQYKSGVGQLPIPVVYGMTWGELADMINGEGWLDAGKNACKLTVIPCKNYSHQTKTSLIRNPSPNIKDMRAVYLYASTCFFENTLMSVGRGTDFPFEAYGSPYLKDVKGFDFTFTPKSMAGATEPPFMDETCYGVDLREVSLEEIWEKGINVEYLVSAYNACKEAAEDKTFWGEPDDNGLYWIDKLSGSDELRKMIEEGKTAEEIKASWQEDISAFKEQRKPYLLYEE